MRRIIASILALAALMGLAAVFSPTALADGDPASDVLVFKSVFNPPDSHASPEQAALLQATVQAANRAGYPIRVALIGSSGDLGTVTQLWGNPDGYAKYLGLELSLQWRGKTLIVMPQGYALWVNGAATEGDSRALGGLAAPGSDLAGGAQMVVQRLVKDNGLSLPAKLSLPALAAPGGSSSAVPLIGFVVGLLIVVGAWVLSLRARPLRGRAVA